MNKPEPRIERAARAVYEELKGDCAFMIIMQRENVDDGLSSMGNVSTEAQIAMLKIVLRSLESGRAVETELIRVDDPSLDDSAGHGGW